MTESVCRLIPFFQCRRSFQSDFFRFEVYSDSADDHSTKGISFERDYILHCVNVKKAFLCKLVPLLSGVISTPPSIKETKGPVSKKPAFLQ